MDTSSINNELIKSMNNENDATNDLQQNDDVVTNEDVVINDNGNAKDDDEVDNADSNMKKSKRKTDNIIPKLIDNKRAHLEKKIISITKRFCFTERSKGRCCVET